MNRFRMSVAIDAIAVSDENGFLGLGFNDVILADTFLGTEGGVCRNLSVEELLLRGRRMATTVGDRITTDGFSVLVNGEPRAFNRSVPIAQIVISPLQFDRLYGRAIFGALCHGDRLPGLDRATAEFDPADTTVQCLDDPQQPGTGRRAQKGGFLMWIHRMTGTR